MKPLNFLTPDEAAKVLKIKPITIYRNIRAGELKAVLIGNKYRITDQDFQKFIEKHYVAPTASKVGKSTKKKAKSKRGTVWAKQNIVKKQAAAKKKAVNKTAKKIVKK